MKTIYFARHSFAEISYSKSDFEREITREGFDKIEEQCDILSKEKAKIDLIICSSAKRTIQTAKYIKLLLKINKDIIDLDWLYEEYPSYQFLELIQNQSKKIESLMIVAHNPTISVMASNFNLSKNYELMPSGIIKMDFDVSNWDDIELRSGKESLFLS